MCLDSRVSERRRETVLDSSEDSPSNRGHATVTPLQKGMKRGQDLSERVDLLRSPFAQKEGTSLHVWGGWRRAPFSPDSL